jgi:hypothetical protein
MSRRLLLGIALAALAASATPALADGGPIMPLSDVQPGMDCTADTVIQGTTITSFDVHVINIVQQPGQGPRILISASGPAVDPTGIAEGFSGSPVYCPGPDGTPENAGAISEGIGDYGGHLGLATPIQQMLGEAVKPPSSAPKFTGDARPLISPLMVSGLSPSLLSVFQRAAAKSGRRVMAAPADSETSFPVQQLVPGASVATSYSVGAIGMGAIGTVTYRDGNNVYAFGHELDGAGRRDLLLQDAYVDAIVNDPNPVDGGSFKFAAPGHTLGTLTDDTPNAVIGQLGAAPALIPVDVTAKDLDTSYSVSESSQVANETDVGTPLGVPILDTVAPLAVGQAAIDVFNGPPASESGQMCLTVTLRERNTKMRFCNRYVGTGTAGDGFTNGPPEVSSGVSNDVATALGLIDSVRFATLHVTKIQAAITVAAGLDAATILSAHIPTHVRAGHTVKVRLRAQIYRGPIRTFTFGLRIPKGMKGAHTVTFHGATSPTLGAGGGGGLSELLSGLFGGGGGGGAARPKSLQMLKQKFAAVPGYDGVLVRFGKGEPTHGYRNSKVVIVGSTKLSFNVSAPRRKTKPPARRTPAS